jgi:predicted PurR-regulated permease PerM
MSISVRPDPLADCLPSGPQSHPDSTPTGTSASSRITALVLAFGALYIARAFFIPVAFALLLTLALRPVVRWLARRHIAPATGAAIVMLVGAMIVGLVTYELAPSAREWIATTPAAARSAARKWHALATPIEQVASTADQIAVLAGTARQSSPTVVVQGPTIGSRLFGTTQVFVAGAIEVLLLLYALLAVGDALLDRVVHAIPRCRDRTRVIAIARAVEGSVSTYLLTTAAINISEGLLVTAAMALLGMPMPFLWGALVAVAEFIPYLGMIAMLGVLTIGGLTTFDNLSHALLVPAAYLAINFIQGNVVTPIVMSRRLTLNPVAIFLSLALWWWLWGIAGALLAVPLLAAFKICCDHVESLAPIAALLSHGDVEVAAAEELPLPVQTRPDLRRGAA